MTANDYRADIDGLRALAIIPVVIFHAAPSLLPGGHLGVDIFFVISGYLITRLILKDLSAGSFSFGQFYWRRAKRLLPAFLFMVAAVLAAGYVLAAPGELVTMAKTALFSVFSASNIELAVGGDYFSSATAENPLMHTWSLAIEEQFYLAFPLIAFAVFRIRPSILPLVIAATMAVSFIFMLKLTAAGSPWAHYSPLSRAWQLAAGCLLAYYHARNPSRRHHRIGATLGALGVAALLALFAKSGSESVYAPALAVISVAAIIHFGASESPHLVGRILSSRPLVAIGLISYSTYLWHQPIIAFAARFPQSDTPAFVPVMLIISFLVGWLSWRFVETPCRRTRKSPRIVLPRIGFATAACLVVAGVFLYGKGIPSRMPAEARLSPESFAGAEEARACGGWSLTSFSEEDICVLKPSFGPQSNEAAIAIWGDSHAAGLISGYASKPLPRPVVGMAFHGCFVGDAARPDKSKKRLCEQKRSVSFQYLKDHPEIQTIVVHARWEFSLNPSPGGATIRHSSLNMIDRLADLGRRVIIVDSVPVHRREVLPMHNRMVKLGLDPSQALPVTDYRSVLAKHSRALEHSIARPNVEFLSVEHIFCDDASCSSHDGNGNPLYRDEGHLNPIGASLIVDELEALLQ